MEDSEPETAAVLDESTLNLTLATSQFLYRISNIYKEKVPFMASDCTRRAFSLLPRSSNTVKTGIHAQKLEKLRRFICSKCKTYLIAGKTATLDWKSANTTLRRFGGKKTLMKMMKRKELGLALSKKDDRRYGRYQKSISSNSTSPSLVITCSTCQTVTGIHLSSCQKTSIQISNTTPAEQSNKKKSRRRKKMPNAGLNVTGTDISEAGSTVKIGRRDSIGLGKTGTPFAVSTPMPSGSTTFPSGSGNKKKFKSRLDKLLAEEEKKGKKTSLGSGSGLASFLESM